MVISTSKNLPIGEYINHRKLRLNFLTFFFYSEFFEIYSLLSIKVNQIRSDILKPIILFFIILLLSFNLLIMLLHLNSLTDLSLFKFIDQVFFSKLYEIYTKYLVQ